MTQDKYRGVREAAGLEDEAHPERFEYVYVRRSELRALLHERDQLASAFRIAADALAAGNAAGTPEGNLPADRAALGIRMMVARRRRNITQPAMAELLGVSCRAYRGWERGEASPTTEMLAKIASAMRCSILELVG